MILQWFKPSRIIEPLPTMDCQHRNCRILFPGLPASPALLTKGADYVPVGRENSSTVSWKPIPRIDGQPTQTFRAQPPRNQT
jgi:hypothetical protein